MQSIDLKNSFGNVYLSISYDENYKWLYCNWAGLLSVESVKAGALRVLGAIVETGCTQILNDNRLVTGSWSQANDWIENVWIPEVINAGLKQFAHVVPESYFVKLSAEEMQMRVGSRFEMIIFEDIQDAKSWLKASREKLIVF